MTIIWLTSGVGAIVGLYASYYGLKHTEWGFPSLLMFMGGAGIAAGFVGWAANMQAKADIACELHQIC